MDRRQFLESVWPPYPTLPTGWRAGRILEIIKSNLSVQTDQGLHKLSFSNNHLLQFLVVGDWIGYIENSPADLILLAPALRAPRKIQFQKSEIQAWSLFLNQVRTYLNGLGFLEVQTPTLVECPGTEPFLDPVACGAKFLPTSPELHLKKALSMGLGPLYEIRPCFRAGEFTERHRPEFWMLEWYRPFENLQKIQQDLVGLVEHVSGEKLSYEVKSMQALFQEQLNFQLQPQTTQAQLIQLCEKLGLRPTPNEPWDDTFNLLFVDRIEAQLGTKKALFLKDYPPEMAALARLTPQGWGDRFEFYWKGMELANAFHELNDPVEQRNRAQQDLDKKNQVGRSAIRLDEDFFSALEEGMPPSAGVALGLDRLFMCLSPNRKFSDFRIFSDS